MAQTMVRQIVVINALPKGERKAPDYAYGTLREQARDELGCG